MQMRTIQINLKQSFSEHSKVVDTILEYHQDESKEDKTKTEKFQTQKLKFTSLELFRLFSQYKDIIDIRMQCFKPLKVSFEPLSHLVKLIKQLKVFKKVKINLQMDEGLPLVLHGEKDRMEYIIY